MNDGITISTLQLFQMFPDQESARLYLESRLWPAGPRCPVCGLGERITARKGGYYRCNACAQDFTVRTGTIMERSHIPLHHWIAAFVLVAQDPAIPVATLAATIDVTSKTASAVIERIYEALNSSVAAHLDMDGQQFRLVDGFPAYRIGRDGSVWTRWRAGKGGRLGFAWREMAPKINLTAAEAETLGNLLTGNEEPCAIVLEEYPDEGAMLIKPLETTPGRPA